MSFSRSRSRSPDTFRKRRETYWDVKESPYGVPLPPAGMSAMSGHAEGQGNAVPAPNPAAAAQAVAAAIAPNAVVPPASVAQQMQAGELAATMAQPTYQATRHARRLYVGNLPADSTDADVSEFFNKSMTVAGGVESPGNPVLSVYLNLDKRFAFIELRTMAEAAAALQMDGVLFRGMSLRMRRPNDYNPIAFPPVEPPASFNPSLLGIVSTQVPDGPNKVFIGGIPYHLTEDQIKELLQAYGPLGAFNLIKDANTGLSKGYAFFEYQDPSIIDVACQGLNGMQINDKTLTVRRANVSYTRTGFSAAPRKF
uniref:RRM domain-containing protein n=1 Tax=Rhodosorus marinus TaxID=101924 RepID=A0A7S3END1_9RHOD|mmetsp:Transcript_7956/g.35314  ORF Transcript_7956/g.35314 Transcript_7956/m.35314 type:complete len:311 (+) Transcript_7956:732-1664(+)